MSHIDSEAITQFCNFAGTDADVAKTYLAACEGDVNGAVTLYLESMDYSSTTSSRPSGTGALDVGSTSPPPASVSASSPERGDTATVTSAFESDEALARQLVATEETVRAPIAPKREVLLGADASRTMEYTPQFGRNRAGPSTSAGRETAIRPINAFSDINSRSSRPTGLEGLFASPIDIMTIGDFDMVRNSARAKGKWMMIDIQEPGEFGCQVLNRDLWSDHTVKDVIHADFLFMQLSSESKEGKRYLNFYPVDNYPHIAVIDPRTGERVKVWNYKVAPNEFIVSVTDFLNSYSLKETSGKNAPPLQELPNRTQSVAEMSEEEQLRAALAESLQAVDNASEPKVQPTEDVEETTDYESPAASVFDTIHPVERPEPADGPETTRIQFHLADGSRIIRRFGKSDPVRYLFEYVKATVDAARDQPFELVFNRKQLIEQIDQTIREAGLERATVLVGV